MSLLDLYANQSVTWRQRTGNNNAGEPTFAADATIAARWVEQRKLIRNAQGEQVASEAGCQTTSAVSVNDVLVDPGGRSWTVMAVSISYDLDGVEVLREARV